MASAHDHNPDPNTNAVRIVRKATAGVDALPAEVEAALGVLVGACPEYGPAADDAA